MYNSPMNLREGIEIVQDSPVEIKGEDTVKSFY